MPTETMTEPEAKIWSQTVQIERHDLPDGLSALTFAEPGALKPSDLVIVLHGLGSRKERHLEMCLRLARAGFLACVIDARHHGDRRTHLTDVLLGDRTTPEFAAVFSEVVQGTVADVIQTSRYFGYDRYGLIGHSMGGFIAVHAALANSPHVAAVVSLSGSIDMRPPGGASVPPEQAALMAAADPASQAASLYPCALLLLHGAEDTTVPVEGAQYLYDAVRPYYNTGEERLTLEIEPHVGHVLTQSMAERAVAWMNRFMKVE